MKRLPFILVLILLTVVGAAAQEKPACPSLSVWGPERVPEYGDIITFEARTENVKGGTELKYKWETNYFEIIDGQGTDKIKIRFEAFRQSITATVEVMGFPAGCPKLASETINWDFGPQSNLLTEYGALKFSEEKAEWNKVVEKFTDHSATLTILIYRSKGESLRPSEVRAANIKKYLVTDRGIDPTRLTFLYGEAEAARTEFHMVPAGAESPKPKPIVSTVCPSVIVETSPIAVIDGYPMTFTAKVDGDDSKLKYIWMVSKGEISEGQGTPEIKVDTLGYAGEEIEAILKTETAGECKARVRATGVVKAKPYLDQDSGDCPRIDMTGLSKQGYIDDRNDMVFTVNIGDLNGLKYKWSTSHGTITEGLGTPVIRIPPYGLDAGAMEVKVEIDGLPANCEKVYTYDFILLRNPGTPRMTDQYDKMPFAKEKERLANVAFDLKQKDNEGLVAIFFIRHSKKDSLKVKDRVFAIREYLKSKHSIPENRIRIYLEEDESVSDTEIYIQPTYMIKRLQRN